MAVSFYIRIHRRPTCWRVAVIWRCYHRAAYPTPEDVLRRVIAGLSASAELVFDATERKDDEPRRKTCCRDDKDKKLNDASKDFTHHHCLPLSVQSWGLL